MRFRVALALLALGGCSGRIVPQSPSARPVAAPTHASSAPARMPIPATPIAPRTAVTTPGPTAHSTGVVAGPEIASLPIDKAGAQRTLAAFVKSCPALQRGADVSGLTQASDWIAPCATAATARDARAFFRDAFDAVQVGSGAAFATGYYEPEIAGSRTRSSAYPVPLYRRPDDLIEVDLGSFSDALAGKKIRGRVAGLAFVPYYDRGEIEDGALGGRGLEIAWAADPYEAFFLEVQGSGRLRLPDGSVLRLGYASQNGRDYIGIGKLMADRGLLGPDQRSMQGIVGWLHAHPDQADAILRENKSYVFFRELTGEGPVGAMGVAVTPRATVAADPAFVPLGAPVFLSMDRADATGLWIAQDTGGAIKGANRFDSFWGAGAEARAIAGGMSARGTAFVLLPKGVLARLGDAAAQR